MVSLYSTCFFYNSTSHFLAPVFPSPLPTGDTRRSVGTAVASCRAEQRAAGAQTWQRMCLGVAGRCLLRADRMMLKNQPPNQMLKSWKPRNLETTQDISCFFSHSGFTLWCIFFGDLSREIPQFMTKPWWILRCLCFDVPGVPPQLGSKVKQ